MGIWNIYGCEHHLGLYVMQEFSYLGIITLVNNMVYMGIDSNDNYGMPPWHTHQISIFDWYYNFDTHGRFLDIVI